jgi:quercetin dioxygenase-like cupin family protein
MEDIMATPKTLEALIGYQKDSVVSKTIIDKKTGTVTLFAFDKDQGLSEHTAPYDAVCYIVDGKAEITIGSQQKVAQKGEIIIMPADKPHSLKAAEQFKMLLVMVRSQQ